VTDENPEDFVPDDFGSPDVALNKDGSVRKKPGPKPGTKRKPPSVRAPGVKTMPAAPRKPPTTDFRPALLGIMQLPQAGLALAARMVKSETLKTSLALDGMTLGIHAPNLAEAINTTAQHDEKLAKICEKLSTVGPYSLVITAVLTPAFQILANHHAVPANPAMGILGPEDLMETAARMLS
jgi:hypothetical protein